MNMVLGIVYNYIYWDEIIQIMVELEPRVLEVLKKKKKMKK